MNLAELKDWIKSAEYVECDEDSYDSSSNRYETRIYQKNGQHYRICFCNNHPSEVWGEKGFIRNHYAPTPVKKASWMEYNYKWENV